MVDWEVAGFWPEWWEYRKALFGGLNQVMPSYPKNLMLTVKYKCSKTIYIPSVSPNTFVGGCVLVEVGTVWINILLRANEVRNFCSKLQMR